MILENLQKELETLEKARKAGSARLLSWTELSFLCPLVGVFLAVVGVIGAIIVSGRSELVYWSSLWIVFAYWFPTVTVLGAVFGVCGVVSRSSPTRLSSIGSLVNTLCLLMVVYLMSSRVQFLYLSGLARIGFRDAQYEIGTRYLSGEGVAEDDDVGLSWLKRAAEAGHTRAQCDLGSIYAGSYADIMLSLKVQDGQVALKWYRMCAESAKGTEAYNARLRLQRLEARE
jgi:TPR repeat protein